jgi:hypothetical protein
MASSPGNSVGSAVCLIYVKLGVMITLDATSKFFHRRAKLLLLLGGLVLLFSCLDFVPPNKGASDQEKALSTKLKVLEDRANESKNHFVK